MVQFTFLRIDQESFPRQAQDRLTSYLDDLIFASPNCAKATLTEMKSTEPITKRVYFFGNKTADGHGYMKPLLGGKGANLAEMSRIGLPVPPGFTITTEVCTEYHEKGKKVFRMF